MCWLIKNKVYKNTNLIKITILARNNWKGIVYNIMITRRDCLLLLSELSAKGIDTDNMMRLALKSADVNIDVVKFINSNRQLDANAFYEKVRRSYNHKKSNLYKNIVTCDEVDCSDTVLTTLAALNLQILLFRSNVSDVPMFLKHTRFEEINKVLLNYSKTYDLVPCIKVLQIIKADLKAFEYITKN